MSRPKVPVTEPDEVIHVPCQLCRKLMPVTVPGETNFLRAEIERAARSMAVHEACRVNHKVEKAAKALEIREMQKLVDWEGICPPEFRKPLDTHKKAYNATRYQRVMAWGFGEVGMYICGPTDRCKTRFAYKLLEREHRAGRTVGAYMHADLRRMFTALAAGDQAGLDRFVGVLVKLELLLIDDLGKGKATPASEEAFFAIIDGRGKHCRPTLFTSELSREAVCGQFSQEFQAALLRRLSERTQLVVFK